MACEPYPLLLQPILKPKVWGGRRLGSFGKELPTDVDVGESWEVADLASTSTTGGGGGAARSRIVNGPLAGQTLGDALDHWGPLLVGARWADAAEFPLLVKLLDAREHLSVQVHPTPEYARTHPGCHTKTETWFVIEAEPGAVLFLGLKPGTEPDELRAAVAAGRVTDVLRQIPVRAGECHHLASGTIHALGAGIVIAEVQSPSDTTFRLYDWSAEYARSPRRLHVDEALESLLVDAPLPPTRLADTDRTADLARTDRYAMRAARWLDRVTFTPDRCAIVTCVDGGALVTAPGTQLTLDRGSTAVIPAATARSLTIDCTSGTVLITELAD